ncbi:unnamed protein product [Angiostrongylus costaricensis]|uniref:PlsC domain-containing protein n=1 Tax=Angiostrongylus costaricensis TaxID=334426 RepID=A0A0R3PX31_ANGCS|nr:unnamed protein product [Angiostrongylus costaricensis]
MLGKGLLDEAPTSLPRSGDMKTSAKIQSSVGRDTSHATDFRKMVRFLTGTSFSAIFYVRYSYGYIGAGYFLIMTVFIVPVACVATVLTLFPMIYLSLPVFNYSENNLCRLVNNLWVSASVYCGLNLVEYGADLSAYTEKRCLFLANHLGLVDHFIVMQSLHNKGRVSGNWMWVIYNIWKYTPLGIMWMAHGNFFINGGASRKTALLRSFKNHLRNFFYKFDYRWIVMYPEGSRLFLIKESCARFAEEMRLQPLSHCVYPRSGAAHAVIDVLGPARGSEEGDLLHFVKILLSTSSKLSRCGGGPPIEYIIDATLGYPKGIVPDIRSILLGEKCFPDSGVCIHYEVIRVNPEWHDESKLQGFLYKRYQEKVDLDSIFIIIYDMMQILLIVYANVDSYQLTT